MFHSTTKWETVMKKPIILAAVAFISCGVTSVQADSAFDPRSVTVRFTDIDTTNPPGAAALYRRLKGAATSVCRDLDPGKELARLSPYVNCIQAALGAAIVQIDRPALTAYAAAHAVPTGDSAIRIAGNK
jgi:UrcA family protein